MRRGKEKCEHLRRIRANVAKRFGLNYTPYECHHEGDCPGTCPMCDAELADLERQIQELNVTNIDEEGCEADEKRAFIREMLQGGEDGDDDIEILQGDVMPPEDHINGNMQIHPLEGESELLPGVIPSGIERPEIVSKERRLFKRIHIAGIGFHDIEEIWDELYVGTKLALVPEPDNKHDENAVAVALMDDFDPENPEEFDFDFILGYVPRKENSELAAMLNMGWRECFSAEISELNKYAPMERRIAVDIFVESKEKVDLTVLNRIFALKLDEDESRMMRFELLKKGAAHFRWGGYPPEDHILPMEGQNVVVSDGLRLYLMKVVAIGEKCAPLLMDRFKDDIHTDDDRACYVLTNIKGPIEKKTPCPLDFVLNEATGNPALIPQNEKDLVLTLFGEVFLP